jgi:hypothetical protein
MVERMQRSGTFEIDTDPATGKPRYRGRLRLSDGTKSKRFDLPSGMNEAQARAHLAKLQARKDEVHTVSNAKTEDARKAAAAIGAAHGGETCTAWHERFLASAGRSEYEDPNKLAPLTPQTLRRGTPP